MIVIKEVVVLGVVRVLALVILKPVLTMVVHLGRVGAVIHAHLREIIGDVLGVVHHAAVVIGDGLLEGSIRLVELLGVRVGSALIGHVVRTRCRRLYLHGLLSLLADSLVGTTVIPVWLEGVLHLLFI